MNFHATPIPRRWGPLTTAVRRSDVVHILGYRDPVGTMAALVAKRSAIPYLVEPAGMHKPRTRSVVLKVAFEKVLGRWLLDSASALIATSDLEAMELTAAGFASNRVVVRSNGVSVGRLLPLPPRGYFRATHGIPPDVPLILSLGRISRKKRLGHLAQALGRIRDAHGLVIGPDDQDGGLDDLLQARAEYGVVDRLTIIPRGIWGLDRAQLFSDADCFCMPSEAENFGTAAVEAAAVGLPVVISDRCGGAEWLHEDASIVFPYSDIGPLTRALQRVLHEESWKVRASQYSERLRTELSWPHVTAKQLAIYEQVLNP